MTERDESSRPACRDQHDVVHRAMHDSGRGSAGTTLCGNAFLWSHQVEGDFLQAIVLVVEHADNRPVTCMGCMALDLG